MNIQDRLYPLPKDTQREIMNWIQVELAHGRLIRNWDGSIQARERDTSFLDKRAFEKHELS